MPAEDLMLDARQYDKQLLDPTCGQLQLLRALMQVDAWEAAVLMLQWLQVCRTVAACMHLAQDPCSKSTPGAVAGFLCLLHAVVTAANGYTVDWRFVVKPTC
jgi:hypothetical protein